MEYISPISVDLGAKSTGVLFSHYSAGESITEGTNEGHVIQLSGNLQLSQKERTTRRHARRSIKRRKYAKRFFRMMAKDLGLNLCIVMGPNQTLEDFINGLFNRRGFTYLTEDDGEVLVELEESHFDEIVDLIPSLSDENSLPEQIEAYVTKEDIQKLKDEIDRLLQDKGDSQEKLTVKSKKPLKELSEKVLAPRLRALSDGHKPRFQYLDDIKNDIDTFLDEKKHLDNKISKEKLFNLIGNISNFQLRFLRKYFNSKDFSKGDQWILERFEKHCRRYLSRWTPSQINKEEEKKRLKECQKNSIREQSIFSSSLILGIRYLPMKIKTTEGLRGVAV